MRIANLFAVFVMVIGATSTSAQVITFDKLPDGTIVDGRVIGNVAFGFSSLDATIEGGPGDTACIDLANIEGDSAGTLTVEFATPVSDVSYGFALSTSTP